MIAGKSRLIVIKCGGDIFKTGEVNAVAADVAEATRRGHRVIMIHGGGPQATALQRQLGQEPNIVAGRRITDEATLEVMKMVVGGKLNIDLCAALLAAGAQPIGLHGASSRAVKGRRRPARVVSGGGPDPIDFGLVGDVEGVNTDLLDLLTGAGYVPVIACLAADENAVVLNINADVIANQTAQALGADHLALVTGAPGVLKDAADESTRIPRMTVAEARAAIEDGTVTGGMIPKLDEAMRILEGGSVGSVHVVGRIRPGDLLREFEQPGSVGTALLP